MTRLPAAAQEAVDFSDVNALEVEVDAAVLVEDRPRALAAIDQWRRAWLDRLAACAASTAPTASASSAGSSLASESRFAPDPPMREQPATDATSTISPMPSGARPDPRTRV